ncbi:nucleoside-diphosphate-sugar epimerase [Algoriphagus sp. 4150]|uniref:SDR family oxidoreductase n=1 Tax=Algoriphagus sp. 4150 TaxID=2817756 RepID=UPI00286140E8|nr:aldehyde reductase [Algoriphagus sp. 4150]MDR7131829.1 nucleoside-diphosphate-sugar epimerase [Algoriphagus sp. 4150]
MMENKGTVLVTGGTGFVGMRIILQLLERGYQVRTTIRNRKSIAKVKSALSTNNIASFERLSYEEAELTEDTNWARAMEGCSYVLSVASPVFFDKPKKEEEAIRPAVEGILRILKFAKEAGVKRVVMTSNFGAVGFTQTDKSRETTEEDWTKPDAIGLSVYEKSKTLAEMAAWDFIKSKGGNLEFATINPVAILGPSLDAHISGSFHLLENLLNGTLKAIPNIPLNVVDVRDVADLHIRAMENPNANGQRFIASADGQISLPKIAELLRSERPKVAQKVTKRTLPNWVLNIAAVLNEQAKEGLFLTKMNRNVSNAKAKNVLGWKPVSSQEDAILSSVDSMVKFNLIHKDQ